MTFFSPGQFAPGGFRHGFDPRHVPGLVAWWSVQDHDKILNASTTAAAPDDPVASWTDRVANHTLSQGTSANRPLYKTNIVNGQPVIRFDGSNDLLLGGNSTLSLTQNQSAITGILVGSFRAFKGAADSIVIGITGGSGAARFTMHAGANSAGSTSRRSSARALDANTASTIATSPNLYPTGFEIFTVICDFANKQGRMRRNGAEILANTSYSNMTAGNSSNTASTLFGMGSINGTNPAEYDAAEFLLFQGIPSDASLRQIALYFGALYGITVA